MSGSPRGLLRRLERQLHEALAEGSELFETGAFRLHVWRTPDPFYRNVAVPVAPTTDWSASIQDLRELCAACRRRPRVEFFAELWPGLEAALAAGGFAVEAKAPVMVAQAPPPAMEGGIPHVQRLGPRTSRHVLQACLEAAAATFQEPAAMLTPGELERLAESLGSGGVRSAVVFVDGVPVSGASLAGRGPVAELLGVWTAPGHRRGGLARRVCADLLTDFFATSGEVVWLTATSEAGRSLYVQLGFVPCGTHLDYAEPGASFPAGHS